MKMRRAQSIGTVETVAMVQSCDCTQLKMGFNESSPGRRSVSAYMLVECLVYISAVCFLLGAGYVALDRCITSSELLRRSADDITSAIHAGERWRADVRLATAEIRLVNTNGEQMLHLTGPRGTREYRFADGSIFRRVDQGAWSRMIANVQSSTMESDARGSVSAWRWELELQPRLKGPAKPGRVRPLFTFTAVSGRNSEQ
jgi:hypothetical protein